MTDYSNLVQRLRGKKLNCTCAAKSASECCCDTDWPESSCNEAAYAIAAQAKRIAELEAALKPFLDNDWWEQIDWTDKTEREVWVTMADLRTARKVLGEKE